jgi:HSP20 family protein
MSYDLVPRNFFSFPSFTPTIPSLFNDEDDWLTTPNLANGLSVSEDDKKVYVEAALPGIDPKNIEVTYQDGYLWVRGETQENSENGRKYYKQATKAYSYRIAVPGDIDENSEPEAHYKHGVMTVAFQKSAKSEPKKIPVKAE